jgi:cytoskeletal protein CcmA (bactofilin family)
MKKTLLNIIIMFTIGLASAIPVQAAVFKSEKVVKINAGEIISEDFFAAGDVVEISGTIEGDAYVIANQVLVNGVINGDLLTAAGQLKIPGLISQNLRAITGHLQVLGGIGNNLSAIAGFANLDPSTTLGGNVSLIAGTSNIDTVVNGDLTLASGSVKITNNISGDVNAAVGTLTIDDQASINGNINYLSQNLASISPDAEITGEVSHSIPDTKETDSNLEDQTYDQVKNTTNHLSSIAHLLILVSQIIVGLIAISLFPNYTYRSVTFIEKSPSKSFLVGLLATFVLPVLSLLFSLTIIGLPLGMLLSIVSVVLFYLSQLIFAYWLGTRFLLGLKRSANKSITFLIGISLLYVLSSISIVGIMVTFLATTFGLGSFILTEQKTYQSARKLKIY